MRGNFAAARLDIPTPSAPNVAPVSPGWRLVCAASLATLFALAPTPGAASETPPDDYFLRVDLDNDGLVSLQEFLERMSFAFRQMDTNLNDVLEPEEQHIPNAKPLTLADHHARFTAQFRRQDADRDGYLSRRELLAPPR